MIVNPHVHTEQEILNSSFDETLGVSITEVIGANGVLINPATEESAKGVAPLSGASANGTRDLTSANTWYAVPSTVPTSPYALVATVESVVGTVRWAFDNTGAPSATNGQRLTAVGDEVIVRLAANQVIYFASSSAGDDVNWSTKII